MTRTATNVLRTIAIVAVMAAAPFVALAYASPGKPQGYVSDFARVLSPADVSSIDARLSALQASTSAQVAVVTVPSLGGDTIDGYAVSLFQEWGIGAKGADNGVLILVSTGDHEARIEVGYGLEATITDLQAGAIVRNVMIPEFKKGDYGAGISGAVDAVSSLISGSSDAASYASGGPSGGMSDATGSSIDWGAALFGGVIVLNLLARFLGRTKSWWLGGAIGAGIGIVVGLVVGSLSVGAAATLILGVLGLIFDYIVSRRPPGGGRGPGIWPIFFGGFGGPGGGLGGGFGGFGGGRSGGGGASGGW